MVPTRKSYPVAEDLSCDDTHLRLLRCPHMQCNVIFCPLDSIATADSPNSASNLTFSAVFYAFDVFLFTVEDTRSEVKPHSTRNDRAPSHNYYYAPVTLYRCPLLAKPSTPRGHLLAWTPVMDIFCCQKRGIMCVSKAPASLHDTPVLITFFIHKKGA